MPRPTTHASPRHPRSSPTRQAIARLRDDPRRPVAADRTRARDDPAAARRRLARRSGRADRPRGRPRSRSTAPRRPTRSTRSASSPPSTIQLISAGADAAGLGAQRPALPRQRRALRDAPMTCASTCSRRRPGRRRRRRATRAVEVPVQARVGNGEVSVDLQLRSRTFEPIGAPQYADVNVRADWEGIGLVVIVGARRADCSRSASCARSCAAARRGRARQPPRAQSSTAPTTDRRGSGGSPMSGIGRASVLIGAGTIVSRLTGSPPLDRAGRRRSARRRAPATRSPSRTSCPTTSTRSSRRVSSTAVIVPQIVKAATARRRRTAPSSRSCSPSAPWSCSVTTVVAVDRRPLARASSTPRTSRPTSRRSRTAFAYWCLPQILFYGLYALVGETLNARRVFGPFTWAPIVNNLVSIAGFVVFIVLFGADRAVSDWTPEMIALLGGTATVGIVVQAVHPAAVLAPHRAARAPRLPLAGCRPQPHRPPRRLDVPDGRRRSARRPRAVAACSSAAPDGDPRACWSSQNAWLLFMLPYSIIVLSIGTPVLHAAERARRRRSRRRRPRGHRPQHPHPRGVHRDRHRGAGGRGGARLAHLHRLPQRGAGGRRVVLLCFLVGLIPLAVLFVVQRTFYAYNDTRTPFFFTLLQCVLVAAQRPDRVRPAAPSDSLAAGVALGQSFASIVQVIIATWLLHRRLGGHRRRLLDAGARPIRARRRPRGGGRLGHLPAVRRRRRLDGRPRSSSARSALRSSARSCLFVYVGFLALLRAPELTPALGDRAPLPPRALTRRVIASGSAAATECRAVTMCCGPSGITSHRGEHARASGHHHRVGSGGLHRRHLRRARQPRAARRRELRRGRR